MNELYKLEDIINKYGFPVFIRREQWSPNFKFRAERVVEGTVFGTAFLNDQVHHRRTGEYSYSLEQYFYVLSDDNNNAEQEQVRKEQQNAEEKQREQEESWKVIGELVENGVDIVSELGEVIDIELADERENEDTDVRQEESKHISRIENEIDSRIISLQRRRVTLPEVDRTGVEAVGRGTQINYTVIEYADERNRNERTNIEIEELYKAKEKPYFCHMQIDFGVNENLSEVFVGEKLIPREHGTEPIVVSWQSELGGLAYDTERTSLTVDGKIALLQFKRNVEIRRGELIDVIETYNRHRTMRNEDEAMIYDEFLISILEERRSHNELTNIISSIQSNQNKIIRAPHNENLIVQGCAGCGKTMILLHRISYLLYNHFRNLSQNEYLVLSPSPRFNRHITPLIQDLRIDGISVKSVSEYYIECLCEYNNTVWKDLAGDVRLYSDAGRNQEFAKYFYSREYATKLRQRIDARIKRQKENEAVIVDLVQEREELKNRGRNTNEINKKLDSLKKKRRISIFDEEFSDILPEGMNYGNRKKPINKSELYATLLLNYYCYGRRKSYSVVCIDEGQDLSLPEYELIRSINSGAVFNIYGDTEQSIYSQGIKDWTELNSIGIFAKYSLRQNYRNTKQITDFVKEELGNDMASLGINGVEVDLKPTSIIREERDAATEGDRKAIVYKDPQVLDEIDESLDGYELCSVEEVKGLEFETVLVIPDGMTDNELYVAYTRALSRLFLIDIGA